MFKEGSFRHFVYQNGYLLITAAWLFTLSFVISNYWSYTSSASGVSRSVERYVNKAEKDVEDLSNDAPLLSRFYNGTYTDKDLHELEGRSYFLFLYPEPLPSANAPIFWNTNVVIPTDELLQLNDGSHFVELVNGQYVMIKRHVTPKGGGSGLLVALLPVRWQYFKTNDYLKNTFASNPAIEKNFEITLVRNIYSIRSIEGHNLFYLQKKAGILDEQHSWLTVAIRLVCILCFLFFLHAFAIWIGRRSGGLAAIVALGVIIFFCRTATYMLPSFFSLRQFELFRPSIYGATYILSSLGDLLVNTLLFFWLVVFAMKHLTFTISNWVLANERVRWVLVGVTAFVMLYSTLIAGDLVRSLVADSQISFSVTDFFSLSWYSLYGFICFCSIALSYFFFLQILYRYYLLLTRGKKEIQLLVLCVMGLVLLTLKIGAPQVAYQLVLLGWLLLFLLLLSKASLWHVAEGLRAGNIMFWLFFFSASISLLIIRENNSKELQKRKLFAENLSVQADPSSEVQLGIALNNFNAPFLYQNFYRLADPRDAKYFKDSLVNENFSAYLNKYDTKLYVFDVFENPINNSDTTSFATLNRTYNFLAKHTLVDSLSYYEEAFDKFSYISKRTVSNGAANSTLGYVFVVSRPRKYKSDASSYPALFPPEESEFMSSPMYAWAIYDKEELIRNYNEYPFPIQLKNKGLPRKDFDFRWENGDEQLWYRSGEKVVVIVKKNNLLIEVITLFAYLFCIFLFLVGTMQFVGMLIQARFRWTNLKELWQLNIRSQVHTTITFINLFSFIIIGISTILFFINRHDRNNKEKLSKTIQIMVAEVQNALSDHNTFDDVLKLYDSLANRKLDDQITRVADIHGVDVNLYDPEGKMIYASKPYIYTKGVLSERMEPAAYYKLVHQGQVQLIQKEKVGDRSFLSIYVPVRDEEGKAYVYLNIPYFTSQEELNQEISNFLVTLINLNAFIFLIAGMIALLITNRITDSFSLIGEKMKAINLGKQNEEIVWHRRDEIGVLVDEYNKMVRQLEQSAALLAKSEREGAWREMARQVAHEIKNPLTPMKLSIQYLQKAIDNNHPNAKELSANVAKTLVEQIDYLSNIATDFSSFANITSPRKEKVDLVEVLESVVKLFSMDTSIHLQFEQHLHPVWVLADKTHLNRLFTNLVRNAMDAIPEEKEGIVYLRYSVHDYSVMITVQDNGVGIPPDVRDKIFIPNFTTKSSGTGLGLAMCKGIVEQMSGSIWFDTVPDEGTIFYVQIPLYSM